MVTAKKAAHRLTITLGLPKNAPALVVYAQNVLKKLMGNTNFPAPVPTLTAFATAISAGLTPGSTALFKYRAVTRTGAEDWSPAVSLMIP